MRLENEDIHNLIGLIYKTAADPDQWPELLNALAYFVDNLQNSLPDMGNTQAANEPHLPSLPPEQSSSLLASTLKHLPDINNSGPDTELMDVASINETTTLLLSHFKSALQVSQRLVEYEDKQEVIESLLDRLPIAIITVNEKAEIIESNNQAQTILAQGEVLKLSNNCLVSQNPMYSERLHQTIAELAGRAPSAFNDQALMIPNENDEHDGMMVYLTPIMGQEFSNSSRVAVFVSRPKSQPFTLPSSFALLYGLTQKECEVAALLVRGYNIKEIASERFVSENTIRSQVKAVLNKTNTGRQAELIRLVLSGPGADIPELMRACASNQSPQTVRLADGRLLAYQEYGCADGIAMIFLHSVLGCRLEVEQFAARAANKHGIRLIVPDRPGFGLSDPRSICGLVDYAEDIEALANQLELQRFHLAGFAMGGLFAKAVAHELPDRVANLLLISCGVAAQQRNEFAQIIPLYRMATKLARDLPQVFRPLIAIMRHGILRNPDRFFEQLSSQLESEEASLFQSASFRELMTAGFQQSARQGARHISREIELLMRPWDFRPENIATPTQLWHGDKDHHVPSVLGQKLAALMPRCDLNIVPGQGHFMVYLKISEIFESFLALADQQLANIEMISKT